MRDKCEQRRQHDYVWKVLLPECLIKFYMDFFSVNKATAETKIRETPLRRRDDFDIEGVSPSDRDSD
jgi:hypothetical protein